MDGKNDGSSSSTDGEAKPVGPLHSRTDGGMDVSRRGADNIVSADHSHSQLSPQGVPNTRHNTRVDDEIRMNTSTSSSKAVMAIGCSSSTDMSAPNNKVTSPMHISNPHQIPSPARSTTSQNQRLRSGSNALETPKDKDDAYSAWWFLASISESYDTMQTNQSAFQNTEEMGMQANNTTTNMDLPELNNQTNTTTSVGSPMKYDGIEVKPQSVDYPGKESMENLSKNIESVMYELPSWNASTSSSSNNVVSTQPQHSPPKRQQGGEYTMKEQRRRKEWLANDALGGTLNYDEDVVSVSNESGESSAAPYHFIPPQQSSLPTTTNTTAQSNPDWDMNIARRQRSSDRIEWTPQDSSYGAAVPAFGWIPKRIRKLLEGIFLVVIMTFLIFVVVKTGINLKSSGSGGGEDIYFEDDDHYIAFNDDEARSGDRGSNDGSSSNDGSNDNGHDRIRFR